MSNELLQKAIAGSTNTGDGAQSSLAAQAGLSTAGEDGINTRGGSGLLYPDQANRFLDYMWDATILAKQARTIRMRSNTTEIDRVAVGQRIMTVASETNPTDYTGNGTPAGFTSSPATFSKISLTTRKLRLDWEISAEALEDNIEGPDLEDHIARLMATQAGNDVEDVLINGGSFGNGTTSSSTDNLMSAFNGFRSLAAAKAHVVDAKGYGLDKTVFNAAIKALPRKYKQRRNQLRFFVGSNLAQDYLYNLTNTNQNFLPFDISSGIIRGDVAANDGGPGTVTPFAFGIPVINVPLMDETRAGDYTNASGLHGDLHLTFPQNFIIGIKRDVVVYRLFQPKKDTIEYTLFIRVGCAIENYDAHVIVKNIQVSGTAAPAASSLGSTVNNSGTTNPDASRGSLVNFQPGGSQIGTF
jgi:HK97 family phage major capsid protein